MTDPVYCGSCGEQIAASAHFCKYCGSDQQSYRRELAAKTVVAAQAETRVRAVEPETPDAEPEPHSPAMSGVVRAVYADQAEAPLSAVNATPAPAAPSRAPAPPRPAPRAMPAEAEARAPEAQPQAPAAPMSRADERRRNMSILVTVTGALIFFCSFLPWAVGPVRSASGVTVNVGWGTVIAGIALVLYGLQGLRKDDPHVRHHAWAIAAISVGVLACVLAAAGLDEISKDTSTIRLGKIDYGVGLNLAFLALLFAIWPLVVLRKDDRRRQGLAPAGPRPTHPDSPAGWRPDPTGRFEHRYFDGTNWTKHVARGGVQSIDAAE